MRESSVFLISFLHPLERKIRLRSLHELWFCRFFFFVARVLPLRKLFPWFSHNETLCVLFKTTIMETYPACNMSKHPQINNDWDQCHLQLGLILMPLQRHEDLIFSVTWSQCLLQTGAFVLGFSPESSLPTLLFWHIISSVKYRPCFRKYCRVMASK